MSQSFSIFACQATNVFFGKVGLPSLAFAFNMIAVCTFITIQPREWDLEPVADSSTTTTTTTMAPSSTSEASPVEDEIDWLQVGRGVLVSMSQVRASEN